MEKLAILENAVIGEQAAVVAAARKMRQGWDSAPNGSMKLAS